MKKRLVPTMPTISGAFAAAGYKRMDEADFGMRGVGKGNGEESIQARNFRVELEGKVRRNRARLEVLKGELGRWVEAEEGYRRLEEMQTAAVRENGVVRETINPAKGEGGLDKGMEKMGSGKLVKRSRGMLKPIADDRLEISKSGDESDGKGLTRKVSKKLKERLDRLW